MFDQREEARDWRLYVQDMIEFSERVLSYTEGMDRDGRTPGWLRQAGFLRIPVADWNAFVL